MRSSAISTMGLGHALIARPLMALMDSEKAHRRSLLALIGRLMLRVLYKPKQLKSNIFELDFSNPLGLAAGMDKKAEAMTGWENIGFGFIEIGGITMEEQDGNAKPRMFRSSKDKALVNRMGFNNPGSKKMAAHLGNCKKPSIPLFLNVGKSKITPLSDAAGDYAKTVKRCCPYVDGFVINVSSPNTPNLRELQKDEDLAKIIIAVKEFSAHKPVLIKIAPDLEDNQIKSIVDTARNLDCQGIIATNTTVERPHQSGIMNQTGGLSGAPLKIRSTEVIRIIADHTDGSWPIIGVGGISNADDAWEKIINGACLIQIYSSLVFGGAGTIKKIVNGLNKKLKAHNLENIDQAVGLARRS
ncbi:MAG: dihydroorotate dehydrogenase (quinone) [Methanobacteriota archaeon]|nr:MAG: dihydroorotate dehydrogenase (quinone) [Euryarchaeota archaeon]